MRTNRTYGWVRDLPDHRDRYRSLNPSDCAALPSKVDLRTSPHMPEVYDQLQIGSCTANGIGAALEYNQRQQGLDGFMPSRLFIYYNERATEGSVGYDAGAQIRDGVRAVAKLGSVPETVWPYDGKPANSDGSWPKGHRAAMKPGADVYKQALEHQALVYERVVQFPEHIKAALAGEELVVFGFSVFSSFESQEVAQTGVAPMPQPGDSQLGGHCVTAVGYDDERQVWICRNSWGVDWGQAGYFEMPYPYLTDNRLASDFWVIRTVEG